MAEGLAAIALAGNIIQFISFSFVLVSKTKELHQSVSGTLNENVDLEIISQDIRTLSKRITASACSTRRLSEIAHRCDTIAEELLDAISKLHHKDGSRTGSLPTRWQSFRRALKSVWGKAHIEELKVRLGALRDQVTMHIVSDTNNNQVRLMDLLEAWKKKNMQTDYEITAQIQDLHIQLQDTRTRISDLQGDAFWKRLHDDFSRISSKVHQVSQTHTIIASLRYESMHIRQSAIKDAHQKTFAWMYSGYAYHKCGPQVDTGFAQWLQCDKGIYWITGKPGSGKSTLMKYLYDNDETIQNLRIWSGNAPLVRACFYFWKPGQQMQKTLEGLLQTLLHHILHACPDLAPKICPERWTAQSEPQRYGNASSGPWTLSELQKSLVLFRTQPNVTTKFYFHVDGLDEYYGDSWDVIETVRSLSDCPNVKLCLSSRPWNCFQDSFGKANSNILRVHHFTRRDIELFARDNLLFYIRNAEAVPTLFDDLIREIGERAEGVFLWVRLVVRSLRNGIINEDPVSILQERLRTIPSDLEEFFEQIMGSVEDVYRSRMAWTFLIAMRSPHQLKLIHYYFLDQEDASFGFGTHSTLWTNLVTHRCAVRTERRLNGRFKGLLEAGSTINVSAQTKVDFLHRTFSDFLATKRMREELESWASGELNVYTAISRALIAESKFIEQFSCPSTLKLAVELASQGAVETGNTADCFEVIDQAELENERTRPFHTTCGLNCDIIRFAASIGHAAYLKYRVHKDGSLLDLHRILQHAIACPAGSHETYELRLPSSVERHRPPGHYKDRSLPSVSSSVGPAIIPSLVKQLFELGVDPSVVVDGASRWVTFADELITSMDGKQKDRHWTVLEMFLEQGVDVNMAMGSWISMLTRVDATLEGNLRTTLRYLKRLFSCGLNPNVALRGTTLTTVFLRTLASNSLHLPIASQRIKHEVLREFLRHGADISVTYIDRTPDGWFNCVCRELATCPSAWDDLLFPRVEQYRILLEHALDPNVTINRKSTLWGGLIKAMRNGVQQRIHDRGSCQPVRDIIRLSLQYGANPRLPAIKKLRIEALPVTLLPDNDVDGSIQRAVYDRKAQDKPRPFFEPQNGGPSEKRDLAGSNNPPSVSLQQRQVRKRNHGQVSYGGQGLDLKRVRFS